MGRTLVEKLRHPVAISAVLHAATVAWLATRAFAPRPAADGPTLTPIEIVSIAAVEPPPVEPAPSTVEPPPVEPAPPTVEPPPALAAPSPAIAVSPRPTTEPTETAPPVTVVQPPGSEPAISVTVPPTVETAPPRTGLLSMRRGDAPDLRLPAGRWDALDHAPAGTSPEVVRTTGILQDSGRGTQTSDQGAFVGKVNPDGSVTLKDKPNLHIKLALPTPKTLGRALAGWYESDKGAFGAEGDTSMSKQIQTSMGPSTDKAAPGKGEHELKDHAVTVIIPVFGGGFDTTDWLMRRRGWDPYASKKLAFLDATRDERVQRGREHRTRQLALTPQIVQRNLDALWASTLDLVARKRALFALWDECAETGEPAIVAGGEAARRLVIGFIRARLPADGPDAFTPAELAELARGQQSKATFQPYD
jgi:hypothetical protein